MRTEPVSSPSPAEPTPKSGQPVEDLQRLLNQYFPSAGLEESGRWNADTEALLRDFQRQRGLEVTGSPDRATVAELQRAVSWIAHERSAGQQEDGPGVPSAPARRPSAPSTEAALLQRTLDARVAQSQVREGDRFQPRPLSGAERLALRLFLAQPQIQGYMKFARDHHQTVVLGVGTNGGAGERACVSGGIYFGPDGEVGLTGSAGVAGLALQVGVSATAQVTILDGGPERLRGTSIVMGVGVGDGLVGGAAAVFEAETGERIGFTVEVGVGAGLTPLEGYIQVMDDAATGSVTRPRGDRAH